MAVDLGKQIGPLPLGAWVAVVGAGLGVALYTRRVGAAPQTNADGSLNPVDTSGDPGVGTGPGWVAVPPPSTAPGGPAIDTNEAWGVAAINWLIAQGYDPAVSDSAIRKYLAGVRMSPQEYALYRTALQHFGSPPSVLPPGEETPSSPTPSQNPLREVVEFRRVGKVGVLVPARQYIQQGSDSSAGPNGIEQMLRNTVNDPRNLAVRASYVKNAGRWPGGSPVYVHFLKRRP